MQLGAQSLPANVADMSVTCQQLGTLLSLDNFAYMGLSYQHKIDFLYLCPTWELVQLYVDYFYRSNVC